MEYRIVVDSCGELTEEMKADERVVSAPLTIYIGEEEIVDDETFDQKSFLEKIAAYPECAKTACPSPDYYRQAFDCDADHVYAVTLSAELSGSYNSASLGLSMYLEEHPEKKGYVFNSRSASVGETLIALKIQELEAAGFGFEEIVERVEQYTEEQDTFFVLDNLETLRKNGRLSKMKALMATALKIKPILGSTKAGEIVQLGQSRGANKALVKMVDTIVATVKNSEDRLLGITHCNCRERALMVRDAILEKIPVKGVVLLDTAGLSSTYANDGGVIVVI